jgi:hypothetical protein
MANAGVGMMTTQRAWKVATNGGMARRQRNLAPASNCAHPRAGKGKLGRGRLVTSREGSGTLEWRQGHDEASGGSQRHFGCTVKVR